MSNFLSISLLLEQVNIYERALSEVFIIARSSDTEWKSIIVKDMKSFSKFIFKLLENLIKCSFLETQLKSMKHNKLFKG